MADEIKPLPFGSFEWSEKLKDWLTNGGVRRSRTVDSYGIPWGEEITPMEEHGKLQPARKARARFGTADGYGNNDNLTSEKDWSEG